MLQGLPRPLPSPRSRLAAPRSPGRPPLVDIAALEKKRTSGLKGIFNHGKPSEKLEIIQQQQAYIQQLQAQMDAMGADMQNMAAIKAQAQVYGMTAHARLI